MPEIFIEQILEEFDEKFGKRNPESNEEECKLSIGRYAGCDDCSGNQALRDEHKDFISKALEEQMKEVIKCLPSKAPIPDHICESGCVYSIGEGYNQVLEEFKENLKQAGLI